MNIASVLQQQAESRASQTAIIDGKVGQERRTTYLQINSQSARFAALLKSYDIQQGDTVLVFQPISAELYIILVALFRLGLIAMFVDPSVGLTHLEQCCKRVRPKVFIGSTKAHLLRFASRSLRAIPIKIGVGRWLPFTRSFSDLTKYKPVTDIVKADDDLPALITFTSGSTGQPKAAVRTHGFLLAQHKVLADNIDHQPGQVDVSTLPVFVLANLASGITSLLCDVDLRFPGKVDASIILQQADSFSASRCAASPAFFERLVEFCLASNKKLPFARIDTGGAPVFPGLLAQLKELTLNCEIVAVYGSTEAEPIAHIHWQDISETDLINMKQGRGLLAGKPVQQIDVKVIKDRTNSPIKPMSQEKLDEFSLTENEIGEIVVAGDHVLPGYLNGIGNEETKFSVDGRPWHRTADAGYFDNEGRLWLMGRCSAKISDEDGVLYPFAVETVVRCDADVRRCAMVAYNGKRILVIEMQDGRTANTEKIKETLAWAKISKVLSVPYVPVDKRHNAKIDYPELNKLLTGLNI
ncbi:hypothetical protein MNBD_GAMMA21-2154 [hydrothermal vent metagenome]|uniref:AMP-dependent synthetase/ligase domain-containing protein n=1 Tax=hydrothermal vent metagenome TaxID=652676 RepID=A0A3B1AXS2_9ZZZZ